MSNNSIPLLVLAGCALLIALALGVLVWRIRRLKRAVEIAKGWPKAAGRVVGTDIEIRSFSKGISYGAIIAYEYEVAGKRYRSERYSLSGPHYFSFVGRAMRLHERFAVGTPVKVHYDPAKPVEGLIALSAPAVFVMWFVFWLVLALASWIIGGVLLFEPMFGPTPLIRL
jgi:hypothetical protein